MSDRIDVLAVMDGASRQLVDGCNSCPDPVSCTDCPWARTMRLARAAVAELIEAAPATVSLFKLKWGNLDPDANTVIERFESALARCRGEA